MAYGIGLPDTACPVHRSRSRTSMICGCIPAPVHTGGTAVVELRRSRLHMVFPHGNLVPGARPGRYPARAVEAGAAARSTDHRTINIGIVYNGSIHIHHRRVVAEMATGPNASAKTDPSVTIPVINASVESYVWSPITSVPSIDATDAAPVSRRPKISHSGRSQPYARNPVISVIPVGPVSRGPEIPVNRTGRLSIDR
jgi:hypothetical protein